MYVHVRRLRFKGRPIPDHEAGNPEHMTSGELSTRGARFELRRFFDTGGRPIAVLYDAKILCIHAYTIRVRGYEEYNGGGVLQEWECSLIAQRKSPAGVWEWEIDTPAGVRWGELPTK